MATKLSLFFFLLFTFTLSLQLHARESQFFSKFTNQPQQQDQVFLPQTTDSSGYGLYGRLPPSTTNGNHNPVAYTTPGDSMNNQKEDKFSHRFPPLTTTPDTVKGGADDNFPTTLPENYNTVAYTTPIHSNGGSNMYNRKEDKFSGHLHDNYPTTLPENYNTVAYTTPIHGKDQYNGESSSYNSWKQGMSESRFMDNTYNNEKQGMSDSRASENGRYYHVSGVYNSEEQGLGDTRHENGKYYYDLNSQGSNSRPRVFDSRNGYSNRGYFGNNNNGMYNSNARVQDEQEDVFTP